MPYATDWQDFGEYLEELIEDHPEWPYVHRNELAAIFTEFKTILDAMDIRIQILEGVYP